MRERERERQKARKKERKKARKKERKKQRNKHETKKQRNKERKILRHPEHDNKNEPLFFSFFSLYFKTKHSKKLTTCIFIFGLD
jgi:hypothetical protein